MNWLLYCVITLTCISFSYEYSEFNIKSTTGETLPLYTQIYYGITNKRSERIWTQQGEMVSLTSDPTNGSHWWMMLKLDNKRDDYLLVNGYDSISGCYYRLERADNQSYFIYDSETNLPISDAQYLSDDQWEVQNCDRSKQDDEENSDRFRTRAVRCKACGGTEDHLKWSFIEMPDYKLNAIMTHFSFNEPLKKVLKQHLKKLDLMHTSTLYNDSPATYSEEVSSEVKKNQSFEVILSSTVTESFSTFKSFVISGSIGNIFAGINTEAEFEFEIHRNKSTSISSTTITSKEVTYTVTKAVNVPPYQSVRVVSYVDWIENLRMPFIAEIKISGEAPRFLEDPQLDSNVIKILLRKNGLNHNFKKQFRNHLTFETKGVLIGSFGIDSYFQVNSLGNISIEQFLDFDSKYSDYGDENDYN